MSDGDKPLAPCPWLTLAGDSDERNLALLSAGSTPSHLFSFPAGGEATAESSLEQGGRDGACVCLALGLNNGWGPFKGPQNQRMVSSFGAGISNIVEAVTSLDTQSANTSGQQARRNQREESLLLAKRMDPSHAPFCGSDCVLSGPCFCTALGISSSRV